MVATVALHAIAKYLVWWLWDYVAWNMSRVTSGHPRFQDNPAHLTVLVGIGGVLIRAWTGCQWLFMGKADQNILGNQPKGARNEQ